MTPSHSRGHPSRGYAPGADVEHLRCFELISSRRRRTFGQEDGLARSFEWHMGQLARERQSSWRSKPRPRLARVRDLAVAVA